MAIARSVLSVALVGVLVAACTSGIAEPPEPTTGTGAPTTEASPSPTEAEDPFAVPAPEDVDPEYVDLVVNTIWERHGELLREILREDPRPGEIMDEDMLAEFEEIFDGEYAVQRTQEADRFIEGDREGLLDASELDQIRFATERIVAAGNECVVAIGVFDTRGTAVEGRENVAALAIERAEGRSSDNPTHWRITDVARNQDVTDENRDQVIEQTTLETLTAEAINTSCTPGDER